MGRKIVLSQKQYDKALAEGITLNADVAAAGGDERKAIETTRQQARQSGVNMDNATIQVPGKGYNESRIIKMSEIREAKRKHLRENSDLYTTAEFMARIKK